MSAAKRQPETMGIGSQVWGLFEHVRYPHYILCPDNDNEDRGDFDWFRAWLREEQKKC